MIAIVEEAMGEGDPQGGIRTGRCHGLAPGHLLSAEGIACLRGGDHRATSVGVRDIEGEEGGRDPGATPCDRAGQGRGQFPDLVRARDRILRIPGIVEAGQGRAAEGGGASVISGIAGRGRPRDCLIYFLAHTFISLLSMGVWVPKNTSRKNNIHITSQKKPNH